MGLRSPVDEMSAALSEIFAGARIEKLQQLSGGASRETWSFEAAGRGLILQRDGSQRDEIRLGFAGQAQLLRAARTSGVPVPDVVMTSDSDVLGDAMIVARIDGETIPRRILREDSYSQAREGLAAQCGETLARIHSISLDEVHFVERRDEFALYRRLLDDVEHAHPAFELAFRWLERNRPRAFGPAVVHGDFRLGNVIVGEDGIRAVIDWELAHVGDPMEDLGWLCVKSWRFGGTHPVGGFGTREQLTILRRSGNWSKPFADSSSTT